jgi:hypothetical protein
MVTDPEEVAAAGRVIRRFVEDMSIRLRFGMKMRRAVQKTIAAGKTPEGYRPDWTIKTARRIIEVLKEAEADFNARYPWDQVSVLDMHDVVATVRGMVNGGEEDDDD